MKVVCINDNDGWCNLTIGKTYEVYEVIKIYEPRAYAIINDENIEEWFPKQWFKTVSEIRNDKIDRLLK
jgi:hypothetical protein